MMRRVILVLLILSHIGKGKHAPCLHRTVFGSESFPLLHEESQHPNTPWNKYLNVLYAVNYEVCFHALGFDDLKQKYPNSDFIVIWVYWIACVLNFRASYHLESLSIFILANHQISLESFIYNLKYIWLLTFITELYANLIFS